MKEHWRPLEVSMGSCLSVWLAFIHDTPAEPVLLKPSNTLGLSLPSIDPRSP